MQNRSYTGTDRAVILKVYKCYNSLRTDEVKPTEEEWVRFTETITAASYRNMWQK
jgi:hypothetical protein